MLPIQTTELSNATARALADADQKVQVDDDPEWGDDQEDFDQIYERGDENSPGKVQENGSVLRHLLSQVSVGMDLTKITLPTFVLERRSLLEMYADFFAHPDDFVSIADHGTPEQRFIGVVRYYLQSFYTARKSGIAKKPYNPILGETFRCRWSLPNSTPSGISTVHGPFPGSDVNQLTFVAEQVSHHPPVSAFYAEHPAKKISFNAHIWTKSSFLGLSVGVTNIGRGVVTLHRLGEEYEVTFPNGYGRSILSSEPWVELGGKVEIQCEKTGYYSEIDFLTKPFIGGKPHKIDGKIFHNSRKKYVLSIRGEWNGRMTAKRSGESEFDFIDVQAKPEVRKECKPVAQQGPRESRRLWKHVTVALYRNQLEHATNAKHWIEDRQRREANEREKNGTTWRCQYFTKAGKDWKYMTPLGERLVI